MVRPDGLHFVSWMDAKPVNFLASRKSTLGSCDRQIESNGKGKGGWKQTNYPQPSIVKIYNKFMGAQTKMINTSATSGLI